MKDENYDEHQMSLYNGELLRIISVTAPKLKNSLDKRDKQQTCELLAQMFADNLFVYGKIMLLLGKNAERLSEEEIDNIHRNILSLIK